jgi:hypothetical protein
MIKINESKTGEVLHESENFADFSSAAVLCWMNREKSLNGTERIAISKTEITRRKLADKPSHKSHWLRQGLEDS